MEKFITERVGDGIVVLEKEDGTRAGIPLSDFDFSVEEGDVLIFDGEKYIKDIEEKTDRVNKMLELQKKLMKKSKNK